MPCQAGCLCLVMLMLEDAHDADGEIILGGKFGNVKAWLGSGFFSSSGSVTRERVGFGGYANISVNRHLWRWEVGDGSMKGIVIYLPRQVNEP